MGEHEESERGGSEMEQQEYVCEACGEPFDSEEELRKHMRAVGLVE
ncbi:C2H2-type zinc finger protein [Halorussus ruber]|nr:C2H2-type zinc finger protein [Halorussus ruber]